MNYFLPTKTIFGEKKFFFLFEELEKNNIKNPLLICGHHFLRTDFFSKFKHRIKNFELFSEIEPNPKVETVDFVLRILEDKDCDAVIGIGGGSVLDAAKVIACAKGTSSVRSWFDEIQIKDKVPFFALPTTSGSGSELTKYSVLTDGDMKKSLRDDEFYAKTAIIDPELTYSMPPRLTASSGIDAFSQSIEAHWSKNATEKTKEFSSEGIVKAFNNLNKAVNNPDEENRREMSLASFNAAKAFSQTGTTAPHTVSYALTKKYGLIHGFAVALTIPWFLTFYENDATKEIASLLNANSEKDAAVKIKKMMSSIGAPVTLREISASKKDFDELVSLSLSNKPSNPKEHSEKDLFRMLEEIY